MPRLQPEPPRTLGALRDGEFSEERIGGRTVKDELRENLIARLKGGEPLFPGIVGYEDTVVPQIINAVLSRHNFILLGLRGQAKTRILRMLTTLLDETIPVVAGSELRDSPYRPVSRYSRDLIEKMGDETPIAWLPREDRYVEKLATPDVTIADMIGDLDPIKAARHGHDISSELTMHYGLLPRANRGIFAVNELPDLAGKIQVGLFNIMQEGDIQIKGYPVRLPLDVMLVFTANPEDYTARGKIITPLKDRIGSEIRTHYPESIEDGINITRQEAWTERTNGLPVEVPNYTRETVEQIAFLAREDKRIDHRSGVSQRLPITVIENVVSNAEQRALLAQDDLVVPRISDIYAALPSLTGKLELEYEGEVHGSEAVARHLIRRAVGKVFQAAFADSDLSMIVQWFELGGKLQVDEVAPAESVLGQLAIIPGLLDQVGELGVTPKHPPAVRVAAAEFVLEGLYSRKKISRSEEHGFVAAEKRGVARAAGGLRGPAGPPPEQLN